MKIDLTLFYRIAFCISLLGLFAVIFDFGFYQNTSFQNFLDNFYLAILGIGLISTFLRYIQNIKLFKRRAFIFDLLSISFTIYLFYLYIFNGISLNYHSFFKNIIWIKVAIVFTFIREYSELKINFKRTFLNPAQIFILSFLVIVLIGSLLLSLPKATYNGISYIDALFTSTSAVCLTGLSVVDTGTSFTLIGQTIIMILIQIGGLGILTFASYFSYFFKGGTSYENQLAMGDMTSSKKLGEVFSTLKYIILITASIEFFSASLIYLNIDSGSFTSQTEKIYFSAFHAISAFCNAGFSTITDNLYNSDYRYDYFFHMVIIMTFVLGGLGFPIVANILEFIKYKFITVLVRRKSKYRPWVLNINSRITLITTLSITFVAFILFYILEYNNTLAEHSGIGKVVTALFGATTPRTAGFNTIDSASISLPTLLMVFLLMWIGASPQSTGGGIKTSTFAIALLNIRSIAKGKSKVEIFNREIADISIRRSYAIMFLSLAVIGFGTTLITAFDSDKDLKDIAFECFSAYSTVGLSLGITGSLTTASKLVIIGIMFIGRISMLSMVIAIFKKVKHINYKYPEEEITIN